MSQTHSLSDATGIIVRTARGLAYVVGTTVPSDASSGYAPGCIFVDQDASAGSQFYINEGSATSCDFNPLSSTSGSFTSITTTNLTTTNANVSGVLTAGNGATIVANTGNGGLKVGTAANQKMGFWGVTPVVQPAGTGELLGMNGNAATNANAVNMNSNGNSGSAFYSFSDVVKALKQAGMLTA